MDVNERYKQLQSELMSLSEKIQQDYSDNERYHKEIKYTLEHLQRIYDEINTLQRNTTSIVTSLDKDQAIQGERNTNIFYQLEQLERRLVDLERNAEKGNDNTRQFIEKVVMLIIGALVTWLFSAIQN